MKFNKIFSVLACAALMAGTYACTDKVEPTPSPVAGNEEVYFAYDTPAQIAIPLDATQISVTVNRVDASEESTVALTSAVNYVDDTDEENPVVVPVTDIFTIPSSVTFPKGVKEVALEIGVQFDKVVIDREYNLDLSLDGTKTGSYGLGRRTFVAIYLPWEDWELISETDPGVYQQGTIWDYEYNTPVYIRKSLTNEHLSQYMVLSPFSDLEYEQVINMDDSRTIEVDGVQCPIVWMEGAIDTPVVNSNYNMTMSYTTGFTFLKYYLNGGNTFKSDEEIYSFMEGNNKYKLVYPQSYFNPVQGRFYLYMAPFCPDDPSMIFDPSSLETLQLPGDYHDYYFTFNYQGNMVSQKGVEYALVQIVPSPDVNHFACSVLKGEPSEDELTAAVEALAADGEAELHYDGSYTLSYAFEEEGKYTVYAVGFDKDNKVVCNSAKTYTFTTVQAASEWESLGYVDYSDGIWVGLVLAADNAEIWEVEIQEHKENPDYFRLVNPYSTWPLLEVSGWTPLEGNYYIELDARDHDGVLMPLSELGLDVKVKLSDTENLGVASVLSDGWYSINFEKKTLAQIKAAGLAGKFADNKITFPAGTLLVLAGNGKNLFYANTDPKRPAGSAPTYGTGYFCVDFEPLTSAPGKKVARKNVLPSTYQLKKLVDSKVKKSVPTKITRNQPLSQEEIREARFKDVRSTL